MTMYRKAALLVLVLLAYTLPNHAVLKEKNIDNTLSILRIELTRYHDELERQSGFMKEQNENIRNNIFSVLNKSNQNSLMLYSQKSEYIFDLTYACNEATEQYKEFHHSVTPFRMYVDEINTDIARYDSLIANLSNMYTITLSERAKIDRNVCLTLAINIRRTLKDNREQLNDYIRMYEATELQLKSLNDYANQKYEEIQSSIFNNSGDSYISLISNLGRVWKDMRSSVRGKYHRYNNVHSDWDLRAIIYLFVSLLIYSFIAIAINMIVMNFLIPKRWKTAGYLDKKAYFMIVNTVVFLAIILGIIRAVSSHNFLIMASNLLVQYTWLLSAIFISLIIRMDKSEIRGAFTVYAPLVFMGLLVIVFRIVLIPNDLVNLILPPLVALCALWQWSVIKRHQAKIPRSDVLYSYMSLAAFIASVICSWTGYTLLSVQILIWWIMMLTCILTITCIRGWLKAYGRRKHFDEKPITKTWFFNFLYSALLPILGIHSVILAVYWAAEVFNLGDTTKQFLATNFIEGSGASVSIFGLVQVVNLFLIFKYINTTLQRLLQLYFERSDISTAGTRSLMTKNVVQVAVWGTWLLISLAMFKVDNTWLVVVSGGLSTGIGFAMKDILENIYYGVSLMAGRVKVGDYIVCDGIRGKVSSISYTSTMIEAADGSIIAFTNSQLFTKNYKNMTKNNGFILDILEVGVAYGTDLKQCKTLLVNAIKKLELTDPARDPEVVLKEFGDNSVNLDIRVWISVLTQYKDCGIIRECIYETLNDNNIEIPFPQRDVHIINNDEIKEENK